MIQEYSIDNMRNEMLDSIEQTKEDSEYLASHPVKLYNDFLMLADIMTDHHGSQKDLRRRDVLKSGFEDYALKLHEMEKKDIDQLKKRLRELKDKK